MKKILALTLAVLLAFCLISCGKDNGDTLEGENDLVVEDDIQEYGYFEYSSNGQGYEIVGYTYGGTEAVAVEIPSAINGLAVTGIGNDAFKAVASMTSVKIPDSVTYIGDFAFYDCTGLTSVTLPANITTIGTGAFYGCANMTAITLSAKLTDIGSLAFWECAALGAITLPGTLEAVGDGAFWACEALTEVAFPASVKSIGRAAFMFCDALANVTVNGAETKIGDDAFDACADTLKIKAPDVSPARDYAILAEIDFEALA